MKREVIIIGSGVAGLYCALHCAEHSHVTLITKNKIIESSSSYAQGGIAAVFDPQDNFSKHIADTLKAGSYHNVKKSVELLVNEAPAQIKELIKLGVAFNKSQGQLDLGREGGHSYRRIVHATDMTGKIVEQALIAAVKKHHAIAIHEWEFALDVIKKNNRVIGVQTNKNHYFADAVVLATGGAGQIYPYTSNPSVVTGDGMAMAIRAGAKMSDLEFVQFHPTAYYLPGQQPFLLSEALRGEGAHLVNHLGQRFVAELKPRDYVSRAVFRQQRQGLVYLDFRHETKAFLKQRFPGIYKALAKDNFHLEKDLIPITPVAHYMCGGVVTDTAGRTSLPGLYAIGEVARTGVQGANRLASNSLLECLVFATRAAKNIISITPTKKHKNIPNHNHAVKIFNNNSDTLIGLKQQLQNIMWEAGGIVRTKAGLASGLAAMQILKKTIKQEGSPELYNMATVGEQILQAALQRTKSLGCHFRVN
ncbi:MAG: L-aspartate oxidase [Patescibacteria group bacterium]